MSKAIQDMIPDNHCYGCGPLNPNGLQIKSYLEGEETVCTYTPEPHHAAGPVHILNGGIIATLIDCHGICTAIAHAYLTEDREIGSAPSIWYATGSLKVQYLAPSSIKQPVILRARIESASEKKSTVQISLESEGKKTAEGEVLAIRVPPEWRKS